MTSQHLVGAHTCDAQQLWQKTWVRLCASQQEQNHPYNIGNLFTTVDDKSRLVLVHTSILRFDHVDKVTPEQVMIVTLRIGHNLPAPTLVLEHMEFRCNRLSALKPQALQSLTIAL